MDAKLLGSYTATQQLNSHPGGHIVRLKHYPIVSVTTFQENEASLDAATDYQTRTEGPGASSHFVIVTVDNGFGVAVGKHLYFYDEIPAKGVNHLRVTYVYGWNLPTNVLTKLAVYLTCLRVIEIRAASGAFNVNLNEGPWKAKYDYMKAWIGEALKRVPFETPQPAAVY